MKVPASWVLAISLLAFGSPVLAGTFVMQDVWDDTVPSSVADTPASEPNGYRALAVFDEDGDGRISHSDSVFGDLRLWTDRNHDGISQPFELSTLPAAGIEWLSTLPVESRRRDPHGNVFRYTAAVGLVRGMTRSADVFLLVAP